MRTRPLTLVALGVAMVGFDLRVVAYDCVPDLIGWSLAAYGAWKLSMAWPCRLAVVAAVASGAEVLLPYRYDALDPISGEVVPHPAPGTAYDEQLTFDHLRGPRVGMLMIAIAVGGAALWLLLRELGRRAAVSRDPQAADRLGLLAWGVAGVWAAPYLLVALGSVLLGEDGFDPVWNGGWELPALAGLGVMTAVALFLASTANGDWSASGAELGSPWAERLVRDRLD